MTFLRSREQSEPEPEPEVEVTYTAYLWDGSEFSWAERFPPWVRRRKNGPGDVHLSRKSATYGFVADGHYFPPTSIKQITWKID